MLLQGGIPKCNGNVTMGMGAGPFPHCTSGSLADFAGFCGAAEEMPAAVFGVLFENMAMATPGRRGCSWAARMGGRGQISRIKVPR